MQRQGFSTRAWQAYVGLALVVAATYYIIPGESRDFLYDAFVLVSALTIVAGMRWHKPERRLPWMLLAIGLSLTTLGEVIWTYYLNVLQDDPFPSWADAAMLSGNFCLAVALFAFVRARSRGHDRGALIDAAIVSIGAGLLAWVFLIEPYTVDSSLSVFGRAVAVAYPILDVLMLAMLARLLLLPNSRFRALDLLVLSTCALLIADSVYGYLVLNELYVDGAAIDFVWMMQFGLLGAAALHPSMPSLTTRIAAPVPALTPRRLALLALATLLSPISLIAVWVIDQPLNIPLIAFSSAVLFLLVLWRLNAIVHSHQRSEGRERELRRAGAKLAKAEGPAEIVDIARASARNLASGVARSVRVEIGTTTAPPAESGIPVAAWRDLIARLDAHRRPVEIGAETEPELARFCRVEGPGLRAVYVPIFFLSDRAGVIAVSAREFDAGVLDSLEALASHVAVALESSLLSEEVHRRRSESRFRALVQNATDAIAIVDSTGAIRYASPAIERMTGIDPERLVSTNIAELVHHEDHFGLMRSLASHQNFSDDGAEIEVRVLDRHGESRWCVATGNDRSSDPEIGGVILTLRDVTERKALEDQLRHQAFHDPLTGLPNRTLFYDRLSHALARAGRTAGSLAVLFIDVDGFKMINDGHGHAAGDQLLSVLAARFMQSLRPGDTVARFGGDEFAVLLEDATPEVAASLAERVQIQVERPIVVAGRECSITVSVGIASREGPETTADDLVRQADVAMYSAKRQGKARAIAFDPGMTERVWKRMVIEADLHQGLQHQQFEVYYQPIVELASHRIVEVEALVRWNHPEEGMITPAEFIPIAEETGLIVPIGLWVLEVACRNVLALREEHGVFDLCLSVNLSPAMLHQADIAERIEAILKDTGFPAESLKFEITEGVMMRDEAETVDKLRALKALGVRLAIDDFGTGYSSLAYLQTFPIDVIKIDRSFISALNENLESLAIVRMIIGLARSLNLEVTGEGIETPVQLSQLQALGSDLGQGFIFSKPLPAQALADLMATAPSANALAAD